MPFSKPKRIVLLIAAAHFLICELIIIFNPFAFELDDMFYSLKVAENIAAGKGISYGGYPTNGIQPLYPFIMAPLFRLFGHDKLLMMRLAMSIMAMFSAGIAVLIYRLTERFGGERPALAAAALYAFNFNLMRHILSGLETAKHGFLFLLVLSLYLSWRRGLDGKRSALLGTLLGITAYARFDSCFLWIAIAIDRLIINKNIKRSIKDNLAIFIPATLLVLPWFIWSYRTFGTVFQSSGAFLRWRGLLYHESLGVSLTFPNIIPIVIMKLLSLTIKLMLEALCGYPALTEFAHDTLGIELKPSFLIGLFVSHPFAVITIVALATVLMICILKAAWPGVAKSYYSLKELNFVWIAVALAGSYYSLYQLHYSMRHMFFASLVLIPYFGITISELLPRLPKPGRAVACLILALLLLNTNFFAAMKNAYPKDAFEKIALLESCTPQGATVAYTDSGFLGFFTNKRTIVNLDGILNFEALRAMQENRVSEYLVSHDIEYVFDMHNLRADYRHQFETDMLKVLEPVEGCPNLWRIRQGDSD